MKEQFPGLYMVMGETAEVVAARYKVSRSVQDEYAVAVRSAPRAHSVKDGSATRSRRWRCDGLFWMARQVSAYGKKIM